MNAPRPRRPRRPKPQPLFESSPRVISPEVSRPAPPASPQASTLPAGPHEWVEVEDHLVEETPSEPGADSDPHAPNGSSGGNGHGSAMVAVDLRQSLRQWWEHCAQEADGSPPTLAQVQSTASRINAVWAVMGDEAATRLYRALRESWRQETGRDPESGRRLDAISLDTR